MVTSLFPDNLEQRATALIRKATERGQRIATAESCTGGLIGGLLTEIAGSSAVLERGFITYSNHAKAEILGVPKDILLLHGAVSEPVARAMAEGALARSRAHIAVAVTGIAGPGGGSPEKPVGLVHFALARELRETLHVERRFGDIGRAAVRLATVDQALTLLEQALEAPLLA
ncbi:CinA family protein [Zavarzinia aquatilis]|uniref:Damage-inducible protein CinA n=1 Tax=Zavarzinia aquatilis TaxID=2211142 RepID=A0A317EI17_9PROT|nr:CinA family protein [Zavarzinia aquatilis]PWR25936.1 damage-inducible protein CinA [Zavarzinia aquatilis]